MRSFMSRVTRVLIGVMVILIVAVIALFFIGGRQRQFNSQATIVAPASLVFQYLTGQAKAQSWATGGIQVRPLTEGGHHVGAKSRFSVAVDGRTWEIDSEILETTPNERIITALTGRQVDGRSDCQLEEKDGSTTLRHKLSVTPKGLLRLVVPFSDKQIQAKLDRGLEQFKQAIERVARDSVDR